MSISLHAALDMAQLEPRALHLGSDALKRSVSHVKWDACLEVLETAAHARDAPTTTADSGDKHHPNAVCMGTARIALEKGARSLGSAEAAWSCTENGCAECTPGETRTEPETCTRCTCDEAGAWICKPDEAWTNSH